MLQPTDQGFLSTNWLGKYSDRSEREQVASCARDYYGKVPIDFDEKERKRLRFAVIPVGKTTEAFLAHDSLRLELEAWHLRHAVDPSYAGLLGFPEGLPEENLEAAARLLWEQTEEHYPGNL
ncbi:MAG: hypothetical protein HQL98_06155 [Magnetococcales bacterium]|nr:hypothetical protein [Magnetococcales bacterium]